MSSTSATPITANWYQRIVGAAPPSMRCLIAAMETKAAPAIRIPASPIAPRFSARRWP
jgi:hypothetical protein